MFKKNTTKTNIPDPIAVVKPLTSLPTTVSLAPRKDLSKKKPLEPPATEKPSTISPAPTDDEDLANMDYSILDDNENQFETKKHPTTDTTISEAESYATLFQNWENTCNLMNDDQVETMTAASAADVGSTINDEVIFYANML